MKLSFETKETLNSRLILFNTGITRQASYVLGDQVSRLKTGINMDMTKSMVEMCKQSIKLLQNKKLHDFGGLMDDAWQIKKKLAVNVSNPDIDDMYERTLKAGALGGKILGAGGGGYLLVYVPDENKQAVLDAMTGYQVLPFEFTKNGSTVEMHSWT